MGWRMITRRRYATKLFDEHIEIFDNETDRIKYLSELLKGTRTKGNNDADFYKYYNTVYVELKEHFEKKLATNHGKW